METVMQGVAPIAWRQLDRHLWVAIGPMGHLGTIEEGRRFVAIDTWGRIRGRCRTLEHAKAVLLAADGLEPAGIEREAS